MRRILFQISRLPEAEFCVAVGVPYPALRACCQEHLGISPRRHL
jgi:hypothetical protein